MKWPIYLLAKNEEQFPEGFLQLLQELELTWTFLLVPEHHGDLPKLLNEHPVGLVLLPALWEDLASVKFVEELAGHEPPFESVIVGEVPTAANLTTAFNRGLTGYLSTPLAKEECQLVIKRACQRMEKWAEKARERVNVLENKDDPLRDQLIGSAILRWLDEKRAQPFDEKSRALVVATSEVQGNSLCLLLKQLGLSAVRMANSAQAKEHLDKEDVTLIISDSQLPDGTALELIEHIRKTKKSALPRFVVWTSSPTLDERFSQPEAHIDTILRKPPPESGLASLLPTILATVMSSQS